MDPVPGPADQGAPNGTLIPVLVSTPSDARISVCSTYLSLNTCKLALLAAVAYPDPFLRNLN